MLHSGCVEKQKMGSPNMRCAQATPAKAPMTCALVYPANNFHENAPQHRIAQADGRIEMSAGDRFERQDQRDECRSRCDRVSKQSDSYVPVRQPLAHDPRANDRGEQEGGSECLGAQPAGNRHCLSSPARQTAAVASFPMSSTSFWRASLLSFSIGRARNRLILRSSIKNASR